MLNKDFLAIRDRLIMVMHLEQVVPFGRSMDEYIKMFNLSPADLQKRILSVADGPASFNAELTRLGGQVTSMDPIYQFTGQEIYQRFNAVVDDIIAQVQRTPDDWVWTYHHSPENLRQNRIRVIQEFMSDYELGKQAGRYQIGALPNLNYQDQAYDLVLCSHFLFLYSDLCDRQFHADSIDEMLRVGREVRIFPLLTLMLQPSPHLDTILEAGKNMGYVGSIVQVEYELQKGGNQMLVLKPIAR